MNALEQLVLGAQCVLRAARELSRPAMWWPWLLLFALHAALASVLAAGAHPAASWAVAPLVQVLGEGDALVYPGWFVRLPAVAARLGALFEILVMPLAAGAAVTMFAARFTGRRASAREALDAALARAPHLVLAALPATLLGWGLHAGSDALLAIRISSITRRLAPDAAAVAAELIAASCLYAVVLVMQERRSGAAALAALPGTWGQGLLPALVIVLAGSLLTGPAALLARGADVIVERGVPELTWGVALLRAGAVAVAGALTIGAATLAWQAALADREGSGT